MKNKLNIFSNNKINNFLTKFFSMYDLTFFKLEDINNNEHNIKANIVFINNERDADKINFENLNENYIIISSLININSQLNNRLLSLITPAPINNIKNKIEIFLQNLKVKFHDISIDNEKLINLKNNSFCYLTKAELEILKFLMREKEASKNFIKQNILKIKSNIETNSLESHLTRIRKKMNDINTVVKIKAKNDKLLITI
tara:strand:+ start:321 stop:923 length:603 start_codon:yes stop_codon:yes gene_type:complete